MLDSCAIIKTTQYESAQKHSPGNSIGALTCAGNSSTIQPGSGRIGGDAVRERQCPFVPQNRRSWTGVAGPCIIQALRLSTIDPAASGELFGFFRRLPGSERFPGSGMGLALCKRIVERHGGRIWAEPGPGGGSTMKFSIPRVPTDGTPAGRSQEASR